MAQAKPLHLIALRVSALLFGLALSCATQAEDRVPPPGKNRLAFETSPYLLQHAVNPVDWYPWGDTAFSKARREGKFIFLSIGYSTCYWCHVMERESFADAETAALLNQYTVSIKVDREERPDIDEIYMTAVQLMTGRGGWPMTTLLTPDLKPFFGGTYLPRAQLKELITKAAVIWKEDRAGLEQQAGRIADAVQRAAGLHGEPLTRLPNAALVERAAADYEKSFDTIDGGFGPAPKFPMPSGLELLLTHYETSRDKDSLQMVTTTLDSMARGGIHDQIGGGFHRYSTDNQWRVPHFEKMLYDNAQLLHVYARAYRLLGNADYKRVAEDIVTYILRDMTGADGLFYSAQDSEVDTEEGKSYVWTAEEIERLLSKSEYELVRRVWGLGAEPDFEGAFILHWPQTYADTAKAEKLSVAALFERLTPIRAKLLAARDRRPQPHLDDKSITAWNSQLIWALAYAGKALERPDYITLATRAADTLLKTLRDKNGNLLHVARHGQAKLDAYLDDYAATILALLELNRVDNDARWKVEATNLGDAMIATLWDPAGGFYDTPATIEHLLARTKGSYDGAVPAGNSLAVRALLELARAGEMRFAGYAAATLRAYGQSLNDAPRTLPYMLWGLADYRQAKLEENASPPTTIVALQTSADLVQASVQIDTTDVHRLVVTLHLTEGWHVNAAPASLEFLVPTEIRAHAGEQPLNLKADYPKGETLDAGLGEPVRVYIDGTDIPARLNDLVPENIQVTVRVQACNATGRCLAPAEIRARIEP